MIAAAHTARMVGLDRIITFDMGGTSTDVSLYDRAPGMASGRVIGGHPVRVPVIDIHTVGAGGGPSRIAMQGEDSKSGLPARARIPAPCATAKATRSRSPTRTSSSAGWKLPFFSAVKLEWTRREYEHLCSVWLVRSALAPRETADGIVTVVNAVMERAIRVISVQRGHDPRDFTLLSFGGSGGLHAVALARSLGIPKVLIPRHAGVFSAIGMAAAQVSRDFSRTILARTDSFTPDELNALIGDIAGTGLAEFALEGIPEDRVMVNASLDMRYQGQSHEISVPVSHDPDSAFRDAHERLVWLPP